MVLLATLLRLELSDLRGGLVLFEDSLSCTGASLLLIRHLLSKPWPAPKYLVATDPFTLAVLRRDDTTVIDVSVQAISTVELCAVAAESLVTVDSLDTLVVLCGLQGVLRVLKAWEDKKVCVVSQARMLATAFARHTANVRVTVESWDGERGMADCIHRRGYVKVTRELCSFALSRGEIVAERYERKKTAPVTTAPPLVSQGKGLILIDDDDAISPDEEGDEDDNI